MPASISVSVLLVVAIATVALAVEQEFQPKQHGYQQHQHEPLVALGCTMHQPAEAAPVRMKRQVSQQQAPGQASGLMDLIANVGPHVERASSAMKFINSLTQPTPGQKLQQQLQQQQNQLNGVSSSGPSFGNLLSPLSPGNLFQAPVVGQLTDIVRSSQESSTKALGAPLQALQSTQEQTVAAGQQAQVGVQAALTEIGQGLQKIAMNNPLLLPELKNLYSSVSSKLSPPSPVASAAPSTN